MKTNILTCILLTAGAALLAPAAAVEVPIEKKLQHALFAEEGKRDLDAAIEAYIAVIADYDEQRKFAATAVFRLAECHRKKGQKEAAVGAYQRLIEEFPEEETLVRLARENLTALGAGAGDGNTAAATKKSGQDSEATEIARIRKLVELSPDLINDPNSALLHEAAAQSRLKVAEFLLESGADVNLKGAVNFDNSIRSGRTPGQRDLLAGRHTALSVAARHGHLAMVKFLIENGASPDEATYFVAVRYQRSAVLDTLLERLPENGAALLGSALKEACAVSRADYLEKLLGRGALTSLPDDSAPLNIAVGRASERAVRLLLKAGVKPDESTLLEAISSGNAAIFDLLQEAGAASPLALGVAMDTAQPKMALKIVAGLADIDQPDATGMTPLAQACSMLDPALARAVFARGADPDSRTPTGVTPLMLALGSSAHSEDDAKYERSLGEVILLLLEAGADIDAQDKNGDTVLHRAGSSTPLRRLGGGLGQSLPERRAVPDSAIRQLLAANPDPNLANDSDLSAVHSPNELISRYGALRLPNRGDYVWTIDERRVTAKNTYPTRLSELLLGRRFDPVISVYRPGKTTPENIDYGQVLAAGDASRDPLLEPGTMVVLSADRETITPEQAAGFLQRAAAKEVTVIRGAHRWHGRASPGAGPKHTYDPAGGIVYARPGAGPKHTYDPAGGIVYANSITGLLDRLHAPTHRSDLTRVEVQHADGEKITHNLLAVQQTGQKEIALRDGDVVTLHEAEPEPAPPLAIWLSRESSLFLYPLIQFQTNDVARPGANTSLAEFIAAAYANSEAVLSSPDLSKITIRYGGETPRVQTVDFLTLTEAHMPQLSIGDVVDIPALAEPAPTWTRLDDAVIQRLQKLLARKARFQLTGGAARELRLGPGFWQFPMADGLRSIQRLETPGDSQFELLGLSAATAIRALGYDASEKNKVGYQIARDGTAAGIAWRQWDHNDKDTIWPAPLIEDGDKVIIAINANSRGDRTPTPRGSRTPSGSGRRVILPPSR